MIIIRRCHTTPPLLSQDSRDAKEEVSKVFSLFDADHTGRIGFRWGRAAALFLLPALLASRD